MSPQGIEFGKVMVRFSLEGERKESSEQCKGDVRYVSERQVAPETNPITKDTSSKTTRPLEDMDHEADNVSKMKKYAAVPLEFGNTAEREDARVRPGVQFSGNAADTPPVDGGPQPELSGRARGEVIADLILRGRKLRESMLHAVVQASLVGADQHVPIPVDGR